MRKREDAAPGIMQLYPMWSRNATRPWETTYWGDAIWWQSAYRRTILDEPKTRFVKYGDYMRRRVFKAVLHEKWSASHGSGSAWVYSTTNHLWQEQVNGTQIVRLDLSPSNLWPVTCSEMAYSRALSKALAKDHGHYNRWQCIKPTMATRANLAVFLYELRDFKRMWDFIPAKHLLIKGIRSGTLSWGGLSAWARGASNQLDSTGKVLGFANGQHLNYNFGWKPFVSDIRKCWRGMESFEERLHRFQRDAGRELRKRFRDSPREVSETTETQNPGFTRYLTQQRWVFKEQHASAFDFTYSIPQYSQEEMRWRALADTLGLKLTPSQFWAVTPWSFVVDWFVNVGGFLESYENDWLQPYVQLHQGCYSRRIEGTYEINAKQYPAYGSSTFPGISLNFSQYTRNVGLPNFTAVTDPLDADKIRLGTSLLLSLFMR